MVLGGDGLRAKKSEGWKSDVPSVGCTGEGSDCHRVQTDHREHPEDSDLSN